MKYLRLLLGRLAPLAAVALFAAPTVAQNELTTRLYTRAEGDVVRAALEIEIARGWHLYHTELGHPKAIGKPTTVELESEGVTWGDVRFPEPERLPQESFDADVTDLYVLSHEGTIVLRAEGTLATRIDGRGTLATTARLSGLICDDEGCIPVRETVASEGRGPDALFSDAPAPDRKPDGARAEEPQGEGGAAPPDEADADAAADATLYHRVEGDVVRAVLVIELAEDWHVYSDDLGHPEALGKPTEVLLGGDGVEWEPVRFPAPERYPQGFDGEDGEEVWIHGHEGKVVLRAKGRLEPGVRLGSLDALVEGQTCDEDFCIDYSEVAYSRGSGPDALFADFDGAGAAAVPPAGGEPIGSLRDGLVAFLLAAVGWGLFTLLMPCTYPMIPITVSFFTKQAESRGGNVLSLALAYGAGIVLIFVLIGVLLGSVIIPFATHPVTNLVIGILFLYFALVLFGVIQLNPPRFLMNAAGKAATTGGYLGVFLMGATLVVTSFTCTAPFVGSLLGLAADRSLGEVALGMGVFGATMATPFVLLSLIPGRIQALPRSGEWMNTLKFFLGFVEVAAALKFFSNSDLVWGWEILSRELYLLLWGVIFLAAALFLFGILRFGAPRPTPGPGRIGAAFLVLAFAGYNFWGMSGREIDPIMTAIAPNYAGGRFLPEWWDSTKDWQIVENDYDEALALARSQRKLLLVNFTGYTCVNCRQMEEKVFPLPDVSEMLERHYVEARLHTDGTENLERILKLQERYTRSVATPQYVVLDPANEEILGHLPGAQRDKFLGFLQESMNGRNTATGSGGEQVEVGRLR